jgi:hypothetical protein
MGEAAKAAQQVEDARLKSGDEAIAKAVAEQSEAASKAPAPTPTPEDVHNATLAGNETALKAALDTVADVAKTAAEAMSHWDDVPSGVPSDEEVAAAAYPQGRPQLNPDLMTEEYKAQAKAMEAAKPATYQTRTTRAARTKTSEEVPTL